MRKILTGWLIILLFLFLPVQIVQADEGDMFADSHIQDIFTSEDGLLSTSSTSIAQTTDGFIWIGGYGGLVRYDGKTFEPCSPAEITTTSALLPGENGTLWIAMGDKGLVRYENGKILPCLDENGLTLEVTALARAADGTIWAGTADGLGYITKDGVLKKLAIPELQDRYIRQICCPEDGRVFCITRDGYLFCYDGKTCTEAGLGEYSQSARCICSNAADGMLYIGTSGHEIIRCGSDLRQQDVLSFPELESINEICSREDGQLWVCADNGAALMQDGTYRVQRLKMNNSIDHVMIDTENNSWFVSSRQGVLRVSEGPYGNISQSAGLDSLIVNAIRIIGDRMYAGHDNGLLILDRENYETIQDPDFAAMDGVRVRSLYVGEDNSLWIATGGNGLLHYQNHTWTEYTAEEYPAIQSDKFRCLCPVGEDLIAGTDSGACRITAEGVENVLKDPEQMNFRVLSVASLGDTLCFGTDGYGLFLVRDGEIVQHLSRENGLPSNVVMKLYPGKTRDGIWMITGESVTFMDADGSLTTVDQIPLSNRLDLQLTESGEVMILTGREIVRSTEDELLSGDAPAYTASRYIDALSFEITANSNQDMEDDILYLCGSGGIAYLRLDQKENPEEAYQLAIDKVRADNEIQDIRETGNCVLSADVQRIDISAHVLTYRMDDPQIFYWLEGFDNEKTVESLSEAGTISYTNLDGGSYLFHYGILDRSTGETVQEITLPITKEFQWYERKGTLILLTAAGAAALMLILYGLLRIRSEREKRRLREEYEQKERLHLREIAYKDYLTGLYNRNYLDVWDETILPDAEYPVSFLVADCNNLKKINDSRGHKQGDALLTEMAQLLLSGFSEERYSVIRLGGDEFLVLGCGVSGEEMQARAKKLEEEAATHIIADIPVTFSYGICTMDRETFNFEEGLRRSDLEMLNNKRQARRGRES